MIIGDGYLPYHIRVYVDAPAAQDFAQYVKAATDLKREFELAGPPEQCLEVVIARLRQIPGAAQVWPFGGYSAVLGALKMIRRFGAQPCGMYGVIGAGPIAQAIQADFAAKEIALFPTVRKAADSSLEIAIFDTQSRFFHEFQIHFLPMRDRGHVLHLLPRQEEQTSGFLCSRPNTGRMKVARRLYEAGRLVSVRVHGFSRYIRGEDYLQLVAQAQQVFVRYEEMRQLGPALSINFPRGWRPNAPDAHLRHFVERLGTYAGKRRLVALAFPRVAFLYAPEVGLVHFQVPSVQQKPVSDTRFHGALIVEALRLPNYLPNSMEELENMGNRALQASYWGWDAMPPAYPDPTFAWVESWKSSLDGEDDFPTPPPFCSTPQMEQQRQQLLDWVRRQRSQTHNKE